MANRPRRNRPRRRELDPGTRKILIVAGAAESVLKLAAVIDIARRPADRIRGSKLGWGTAVTLINSFGAVPLAYFLVGRRKDADPHQDTAESA